MVKMESWSEGTVGREGKWSWRKMCIVGVKDATSYENNQQQRIFLMKIKIRKLSAITVMPR